MRRLARSTAANANVREKGDHLADRGSNKDNATHSTTGGSGDYVGERGKVSTPK